MPVKIFFCYAHEDEPLLKKLKAHLRPLQREGLIDVWYDRDISAGTEWEQEINRHLNEAQIILLLVSSDFMNSDYCYGTELKLAIERHERGEARVIPVILRPVYWRVDPLNKLQALPRDGKPVTDQDWYMIDEAFLYVTIGIRKAIDEWYEQQREMRNSANNNLNSNDQERKSTFSYNRIPTERTKTTITVEKLGKRYPKGSFGIEDVSLKLYEGELTFIGGLSGSGKSTLLSLLALRDEPTDGRIILLNRDVSQLNKREKERLRLNTIEYLPTVNLGMTSRTVLMNVAKPLHDYDGISWDNAKTVATVALREVGLPLNMFEKQISQLSGGTRARVAIARIFARNRPICLADEILAALDQGMITSLIRLFRTLAQKGMTVVIVSHKIELMGYFDRVLMMRNNRLVEDQRNSNVRL